MQQKALESDSLTEWLKDQGLDGLPELIHEIKIDDAWTTALEAVLEHRARAFLLRDLRSAAGFASAKARPPARLAFAAPAETAAHPHPEWAAKRLRSVIQTDNPAAAAAVDVWTAGVGLANSVETALAARATFRRGAHW